MRSLGIMLIALATVSFTQSRSADAGEDKCGHRVHCPNCHHACEFSVELEKVKQNCFEVEYKTICIPRVTFPWQKSCGGHGKGGKHGKDGCGYVNNGAKAKCVRVLKKYEYECERCKCKWTPVGGKKSGCGVKAYKADDGQIDLDLDDNTAPEPPPVDARVLRRKQVIQPVRYVGG